MFIWLVHRISGVILIVLMVIKIITGYGILGHFGYENIEPLRKLHNNAFMNVPLLLLFIYHGIYGFRTILIDLGLRREKLLFWCSNILGFILFVLVIYFFLIRKPTLPLP